MNFIVRGAKEEDIDKLYDLATQFSLLNLPANKKVIEQKVATSMASFKGELKRENARYLFVVEDLENGWIAGSSQVKSMNGTPNIPSYSFEVLKKERFSKDLGVGFIHQVLRLKETTQGPTEVGGLVVSKNYRGRPEKVGRLISHIRFLYIAMYESRFSAELHSEMAPPLTEEGRSEFWEALGRRFTGMPYQEADVLSHQNKEFIESLFPSEDIYLCLLEAKARLVLGRVGEETQPALHMLEKLGFTYKNEVDPFDGGPHLGALASEIPLVAQMKKVKLLEGQSKGYSSQILLGLEREKAFLGGQSAAEVLPEGVYLPQRTLDVLGLSPGDQFYYTKA